MTKGVKISLFMVLFATISINVFFIVETTKRLSVQTTADYPTGGGNVDDDLPTGTGVRGRNDQHEGVMRDFNRFYNNDMHPPPPNLGLELSKSDSKNTPINRQNKVNNHDVLADSQGEEVSKRHDSLSINAPQRSNQLKLQELSKPKTISIEVLSSKSKVSISIDGTTVS